MRTKSCGHPLSLIPMAILSASQMSAPVQHARIRYKTHESVTKPLCDSTRGYGWMFAKNIRQANEGCDLDFLETGFGAPEIY